MKPNISSFHCLRYVALTFAFITLFFLAAIDSPSNARPPQDDLRVNNKTEALRVVSVEKNGSGIGLSFQNNYVKAVTAFAVGFDTYKILTELIYKKELMIQAGEVHTEYYFVQPQYKNLTLLGVIFEDGTSEGDPQTITEMLDDRIGQRMQIERILPLLDKIPDTEDQQIVAKLANLKTSIMQLPTQSKRSIGITRGLRGAKEKMMDEIQQLEEIRMNHSNAGFMQILARIKARYHTALRTLDEQSPRIQEIKQ